MEILCLLQEQTRHNGEARQRRYECAMCETELISSGIALCISCPKSELCDECYQDLSSSGFQLSPDFLEYEKLHTAVAPLARVVQKANDRQRSMIFLSAHSLAAMSEARDALLVRYEKFANSTTSRCKDFPKLKFGLELLQMMRDAETSESAEQALTHLAVDDDANETSVALDERFQKWRKSIRAEKMTPFPCAGHKFCLISQADCKAIDDCKHMWTEDGFLEKAFLRLWRRKYQLIRDGLSPMSMSTQDFCNSDASVKGDKEQNLVIEGLTLSTTAPPKSINRKWRRHGLQRAVSWPSLRKCRPNGSTTKDKQKGGSHLIPTNEDLLDFIGQLDLDGETRLKLGANPRLVSDLDGLRFKVGKRRARETRRYLLQGGIEDKGNKTVSVAWEAAFSDEFATRMEPEEVVRIDGELPPLISTTLHIQMECNSSNLETHIWLTGLPLLEALCPGRSVELFLDATKPQDDGSEKQGTKSARSTGC